MNWINHTDYLEIELPAEFSFTECLIFLKRSNQEILHQIKEGVLLKVLKIEDQLILCRISEQAYKMKVEFPMIQPSVNERERVVHYLKEWFDLNTDLACFYQMANKNNILQPLIEKYSGLRLLGIPDLFEALVWAIIGQQINLTFAYTLKKRFVEHFGENVHFEEENHWLFPTPEKIACIQVEELRMLQFTQKKSEYIIDIAKIIANGQLAKERLHQKKDYEDKKKSLMAIRGIGPWTADYVLMKSLQELSAFPIADVGLHNALKMQLGLERKPSMEEIFHYSQHWQGWQAYATFYLWRSLYETV
ncbi:DNA-3-methyladenine glycosylase family protein [Lysinibacillus sphaericus]|uniref:DNA-3-methyladenine glycosylase family protein n=1 Tax=Lysinibacillus sphaericus TaxID=1421 RepID=UPI0004DF159D|nr:DNA-3-methyladenine glycosylase [Lysinibacillus sphaericus]QPA60084.1 DNA-3-methyladenine glycosylase 2 family protein [Lysinibacillus sphaericus]